MIGNAHIDPVWLWRWQEGCHEVLASFRSALDRLSEDPEFLFVSSSAAFYQWVEQIQPAMFEEIRARVAEGRWEIVGGWWIQPDCNLPGGESFVRQGLYGQRYFRQKFGVTATVGYNVDSFGHHGTLPQILRRSGMSRYVFMRPNPQELGLPGRLFWWEADDGSRVLTFRIPFEYCTWGKELDQHVRRVAGELRPPFDELMCFYGVGNHGGGPTVENLRSIRRLDADPTLPRLIFSTPNRFFEQIEAQSLPLPVVHDDLQHHASGCYAAHSGIKYWNRRAEWALLTAEKWAAVASMLGGPAYPTADLERAWQGVLFNQFHDIMAGTSIESAYIDARNLHGEALAIADRALTAATLAVAWQIRTPLEEETRPIVVFNPHAWPGAAPVELEFGRFTEEHRLIDEAGNPVPVQLVQSEATANGRNRLLFLADLPALGYRTFRVVQGAEGRGRVSGVGGGERSEQGAAGGAELLGGVPLPAWLQSSPTRAASEVNLDWLKDLALDDDDEAGAVPTPVEEPGLLLENEQLRLRFDKRTGWITSLFDKRFEVEALAGPAAVPAVLRDESDTWSHNVFSFRDEVGRFIAERVEAIEQGPVRSTVRVTSRFGDSLLVQEFSLYAGRPLVQVTATVDWREQHRALKLRFPINVHFHRATAEAPYGSIERFANGEEEPGQSWVDLSGTSRVNGERYGVSIINDGKHSYDVQIRDVGLTVLRSPIYAHHDPAVPQPERRYSYIDQGAQRFRYAIFPHGGGWEESELVRLAAELNQAPIALAGTFHPEGQLPPSQSFLQVEPAAVTATVLKQAEEGDDLIVRAYASARAAAEATISMPAWSRTFSAAFGPGEIKTFRVPRDPARPVVEVSMLEWENEA
jgi:alpha-mannosidase